ncbi:MAG: Fe2+-dependent dioxygenase [Rhodanobacteraceae bacterium]
MLVRIPAVLSAEQSAGIAVRLQSAADSWVDGRMTAGFQGEPVKRNRQIDEHSPLAHELGNVVLSALERHPVFISAALPARVYPPMFNGYEAGMEFGAHVDGAIRLIPGGGPKLRTDVSATLFLSPKDSYDGGELLVEDTYGTHSVKLDAGDLVLYPATGLHRVVPVTRGVRLASFFWVQSMIADNARRALLFDLDNAIQRFGATGADESARTTLIGTYHNLLRMWAEV